MRLPIYLYGHPVLRETAKEVTPDYEGLKPLLADMFETMEKSEGVGLAAPQIGRSDRIVVIDATPLAEEFPECAGWRHALINPEIEILDGDTVTRSEGCLSLPGLSEDVKRVEHIRLRWHDENFNLHEEELKGFVARIVQHECDHLEGMMYIDHISPARKLMIRNKLSNIATGRTACNYPARYAPKKRK